MSTIGVEETERLATMVDSERPEVTFLDAPVSGSKVQAEQRQLTIFASGPDEARPRVDPLFNTLGNRTLWLGPAGKGSRMKLVNNTFLAFGAEAVAASFALARRLNIEPQQLMDVLSGGPLVSPWQAGKLDRLLKGDFSTQFGLSLALKDVRLALEAGGDRFVALHCLAEEWQRAVDQGLGDQDLTIVTRSLEEEAANS
jgi:3-hydroxyisobutyrate dehydrogenase